jgi:hypothetical protein
VSQATHRCEICTKDGLGKDDYCFGCRSFICEDCDRDPAGLAMTHEVEAHEREPEREAEPWSPSKFPPPKKKRTRRVQPRA